MIIYKITNLINNKCYIGQTIKTLNTRKLQHINTSKRNIEVSHHLYSSFNKYGIDNFIFEEIDTANTIDELNKKESYWIEYYQSTNPNLGYNLKGGGANQYLTMEVKLKIGNSQKGEKNHMFGKIGALNPTSIPMIDLTTGEKFDSVSDYCRKYPEFNLSKVCAVCRGDRFSHKGHKFAYLNKETGEVKKLSKNTQQKEYAKVLINFTTGEEFYPSSKGLKKYSNGKLIRNFYTKIRKSKDNCVIWNNYIWYYKENPPTEDILNKYINKLEKIQSCAKSRDIIS